MNDRHAREAFFDIVDQVMDRMIAEADADFLARSGSMDAAYVERLRRDMRVGFEGIRRGMKRRFDTNGNDWFMRFEDAIVAELGAAEYGEERIIHTPVALVIVDLHPRTVEVMAIEPTLPDNRPAHSRRLSFAVETEPEKAAAEVVAAVRSWI